MNGYSFRSDPCAADVGAVRTLVAGTGFFSPEETLMAGDLVADRLRDGEAGGYLFEFAERDGALAGYACFGPICCTDRRYDLYWIAVRSDLRGQGLGGAILARAESAMLRAGCRAVYVETSSRPLYAPTRRFYERKGYSREAELRDFYADGDHKVIYVRRFAP